MEYELSEHGITVKRGDSPKIYKESQFWHELKKRMNQDGHDLIKKLMWKDGHLTDDTLYYLRSRKVKPTGSVMIWYGYSAERFVYEDYNKRGEITLEVTDAYKPPTQEVPVANTER